MTISKSTPADASEITSLVNRAYRGEESKKGWATEADLLDGSRIDEATVAGYLTDPAVTLLKYTDDDGKMISCVYLESKQDHLYLGMLTVEPGFQAGGTGRLMLQEAERFAANLRLPLIRITVITSRTELIAWYERRGFQATGELRPFHTEEKFGIPKAPIELMVMEKTLDL